MYFLDEQIMNSDNESIILKQTKNINNTEVRRTFIKKKDI